MTKVAVLIVSLVLCVGLYSVDAQTVGQCVEGLMKNLQAGMTGCNAIEVYAKCVLSSTDLYRSLTTNQEIADFQTGFEQGLAKGGMYCSTDIKRIVEELREEDRNGVIRTTLPPTGYKDATTFGQCLDTLMREAAKSGKSCSLITPYMKCALRVLKFDQLTSLSVEDYKNLNQQFKNEMAKQGLYCDIDFRAVVKDIGREESVEDQSENIKIGYELSTRPFFQSGENGQNVNYPYAGSQESGGNGSDVISRPFQLVTLLMFTVMTMFVLH